MKDFVELLIKSQLRHSYIQQEELNITPHGRSTFRHSNSLTRCLAIILFFYNVIIEKFPNSLKLSASQYILSTKEMNISSRFIIQSSTGTQRMQLISPVLIIQVNSSLFIGAIIQRVVITVLFPECFETVVHPICSQNSRSV